jgi:hypothetical protein
MCLTVLNIHLEWEVACKCNSSDGCHACSRQQQQQQPQQ